MEKKTKGRDAEGDRARVAIAALLRPGETPIDLVRRFDREERKTMATRKKTERTYYVVTDFYRIETIRASSLSEAESEGKLRYHGRRAFSRRASAERFASEEALRESAIAREALRALKAARGQQ